MTKFTKFLSYLLVFVMLGVAIAACAPEPAATEVPPEPTEAATEAPTEVATPEETAVVFEEQPFGENLPTAPRLRPPSWLLTASSLRNSARSIPIQPMTPMSQR